MQRAYKASAGGALRGQQGSGSGTTLFGGTESTRAGVWGGEGQRRWREGRGLCTQVRELSHRQEPGRTKQRCGLTWGALGKKESRRRGCTLGPPFSRSRPFVWVCKLRVGRDDLWHSPFPVPSTGLLINDCSSSSAPSLKLKATSSDPRRAGSREGSCQLT